jgi:hypothetical protein
MRSQGIEYSNALGFMDSPDGEGIAVRALFDLKVGDAVARIPKAACLTMRTSGASDLIENAGLGGSLGLAAALMYERSLGEDSPWAGYLQLLPPQECLPLLWTLDDLDSLLRGTELHKVYMRLSKIYHTFLFMQLFVVFANGIVCSPVALLFHSELDNLIWGHPIMGVRIDTFSRLEL